MTGFTIVVTAPMTNTWIPFRLLTDEVQEINNGICNLRHGYLNLKEAQEIVEIIREAAAEGRISFDEDWLHTSEKELEQLLLKARQNELRRNLRELREIGYCVDWAKRIAQKIRDAVAKGIVTFKRLQTSEKELASLVFEAKRNQIISRLKGFTGWQILGIFFKILPELLFKRLPIELPEMSWLELISLSRQESIQQVKRELLGFSKLQIIGIFFSMSLVLIVRAIFFIFFGFLEILDRIDVNKPKVRVLLGSLTSL